MPEDDRANTAKSGKNMEETPKTALRKGQNIGHSGHKHRNFCIETSEVLPREVRCFAFSSGKPRKIACIKECIFREPMALPCPAQTLQEHYGKENSLNFHDSKPLAMLSSFGLDVFPPKSKSRFKLIYRTYQNPSFASPIRRCVCVTGLDLRNLDYVFLQAVFTAAYRSTFLPFTI